MPKTFKPERVAALKRLLPHPEGCIVGLTKQQRTMFNALIGLGMVVELEAGDTWGRFMLTDLGRARATLVPVTVMAWTTTELKLLRELRNPPDGSKPWSVNAIARRLGRTKASVCGKWDIISGARAARAGTGGESKVNAYFEPWAVRKARLARERAAKR